MSFSPHNFAAMKKLNAEEAKEIFPLKKGKYTWLYKALMTLEIGEAIIIEKDDWKGKSTPYRIIRRAAKKFNRKFDYGRHPKGSGWLVKRVG